MRVGEKKRTNCHSFCQNCPFRHIRHFETLCEQKDRNVQVWFSSGRLRGEIQHSENCDSSQFDILARQMRMTMFETVGQRAFPKSTVRTRVNVLPNCFCEESYFCFSVHHCCAVLRISLSPIYEKFPHSTKRMRNLRGELSMCSRKRLSNQFAYSMKITLWGSDLFNVFVFLLGGSRQTTFVCSQSTKTVCLGN